MFPTADGVAVYQIFFIADEGDAVDKHSVVCGNDIKCGKKQ